MTGNLSAHYNEYYYYGIPDGKEPGDMVNERYDRVMRNDREALETVLKILASNTYYLVSKRLDTYGMGTIDNIDDVMQNIWEEVVKLSFRGFPPKVSQNNFYPYLIGIAENCIKNFRKRTGRNMVREQYDTETSSVYQTLEAKGRSGENDNMPDRIVLADEKQDCERAVLRFFVRALQETKMSPYQVITYCYAILIPQMFKKSQRKDFLKKVEILSGRKEKTPNSYFDEERNRLCGEIMRNSVKLLNWAVDAMYEQKLWQLDREFLELYEEEPLSEDAFEWGQRYLDHMKKEYEGIPVRELVITSQFEMSSIKNWPDRVAKSLLLETEKLAMADEDFCRHSVAIAEEMLCS